MWEWEKFLLANDLKHKCNICGRKLKLDVKKVRRSRFIPKRCPDCYGERSVHNSGAGHPAFKTGTGRGYAPKKVKKLLDMSSLICFICGTNKKIIVHHIDGNPRNNVVTNLQPLCRSCHRSYHAAKNRNFRPLEEVRLERNAKRAINIAKQRAKEKECEMRMIGEIFYKKFNDNKFWTANQVGEYIKITRERVRQLREGGILEFIQIYKRFYYRPILEIRPCRKVYRGPHGRLTTRYKEFVYENKSS